MWCNSSTANGTPFASPVLRIELRHEIHWSFFDSVQNEHAGEEAVVVVDHSSPSATLRSRPPGTPASSLATRQRLPLHIYYSNIAEPKGRLVVAKALGEAKSCHGCQNPQNAVFGEYAPTPMPFINPTRLHWLLSPSRTRRERSDRSRRDSCACAGTRTRALFPAHRVAEDHCKGVVVRPTPDAVHQSDAPPLAPLAKPDTARALGSIKSGWLCVREYTHARPRSRP